MYIFETSHVICDYCNHIRDIDLCREEEINIWNCLNCHKAHNKIALEEEIINQFNKLFVKFYGQDLKCNKCNQIRQNNMDLHCKCSGNWIETVDYHAIEKQFQTFVNVAKFYNLQLLNGLVEEII